nr:RNA-directed DNA polymerase, eukaryota [Tanacetum cinerariifolium]
MASVLLNGSPSLEFKFHRGLKQGDPLAPYLFILIMESFHLSVTRAVEAGIFQGININDDFNISHIFYADDSIFIGKWNDDNLSGITQMLKCFSLISGLRINLSKSHLLGVGVPFETVNIAAENLGCSMMRIPFKYLGIMVGNNSSKVQAWDNIIAKVKARLSNWKLKTLSVGGRLTLLKSVLGSTPIYAMSIYKCPKAVLHVLESLRQKFFYGIHSDERKFSWVSWPKILASKKNGGLGASSFYALNRALLFKWVWRFISGDNSLWFRFIKSMHGATISNVVTSRPSLWISILKEFSLLKDRGIDLMSHCHIRVGNGLRTQFWNEVWIAGAPLHVLFPRIYALESFKDCTVASKLQSSVSHSLHRDVRGGVESSQIVQLEEIIGTVILSNIEDRWTWDLNSDRVFRVKDITIIDPDCILIGLHLYDGLFKVVTADVIPFDNIGQLKEAFNIRKGKKKSIPQYIRSSTKASPGRSPNEAAMECRGVFVWLTGYKSTSQRVNSLVLALPQLLLGNPSLKNSINVSPLGKLALYLMAVANSYKVESWCFSSIDRNKMAWVSWKKVCSSSNCRGLGIGSLQAANLDMLSKW